MTFFLSIRDSVRLGSHRRCFGRLIEPAVENQSKAPWMILGCCLLSLLILGCGTPDDSQPALESEVESTDHATLSRDGQTIPTTATSPATRDSVPRESPTTSLPPTVQRSTDFVVQEKIERFPNGKVRRGFEARYYPDGEMVYHGRYVQFWESGKKHSKGLWVDGKKEGEWIYWHDNGRIAKKGSFRNGKLEGRWVYVTANGRPKHRDHYQDGKRHGELIVFDKATGTRVVRKVHFKNGVKHGLAIEYFANGNVMQSTNWVDGVEHGKRETFYENGNKLLLEEYSHGKLHGHVKRWSPLGSLESDTVYVDGLPKSK